MPASPARMSNAAAALQSNAIAALALQPTVPQRALAMPLPRSSVGRSASAACVQGLSQPESAANVSALQPLEVCVRLPPVNQRAASTSTSPLISKDKRQSRTAGSQKVVNVHTHYHHHIHVFSSLDGSTGFEGASAPLPQCAQ